MTQPTAATDVRGAGRQLGKYTLLRRIGRGGMAEVWLARSRGIERIDRLVAVKLVSPHVADDPAFVTMLRQEARIATNLDHPNIASVIDFAECDGESFLVTEYVHGYSLYEVLRAAAQRGHRIPLGVAIGIARAIAEALHYAHEACDVDGRPLGIVHRDVSPSNVLLRHDGVVKVVDFGIAKATGLQGPTESGVLKGKCSYMAPEQCNALAVDRRTDVFALGIVMFEVTTGRRLFGGRNDFEVMNRISRGDVVPPSTVIPDYPPALERVVLRALALRPEDRHPDTAAIQAELEAFAREERLDTSSLRLRELLDTLMGPRPHPALEVDTRVGAATVDATAGSLARSTAERTRRRRLRVAIAGGVVATALTVVVARAVASAPDDVTTAAAEPEAKPNEPRTSDDPPTSEKPPTIPETPAVGEPPKPSAPLDTTTATAPNDGAVTIDPPADRRPRTTTRRARTRATKRPPTEETPATPRRPSRSLFPDGH